MNDGTSESNTDIGRIEITFSPGLPAFLAEHDVSLAFTSYQTGRLYLAGHGADGKLALHEAIYPQAMGVAGNADRIYLGTLTQVVRLEQVLRDGQRANEVHDKLFVPRNMQTTGNVDIHELNVQENGRVIFVNTRYSCLSEFSLTHSFKPVWKPDFISELVPEDRCHLNGLAMVDGRPKYVTAVNRSDTKEGWREFRSDGGVVIDIDSNNVVAEGLSMPHSPRVHDGKLWLLNSGSGELGWVDQDGTAFTPLAFFPGFLRGLAFHNDHAFVTLSKQRNGQFAGLSLNDRLQDRDEEDWCGVQVLSMHDRKVVQWIRFEGAITELFDICVLPGVRNPLTIGPQSAEVREFLTMET